MINIKATDFEYGRAIERSLSLMLQTDLDKIDNLVDQITRILIGTSNTRFGPIPTPENLVSIRDVIRATTANNRPIRVVVPWGSIKADRDYSIDLAELMALYQLKTRADCVSRVYEPGLDINIAIEDSSGFHLFETEIERESREGNPITYNSSIEYTNAMVNLTKIIIPGARPITESDAGVTTDQFFRESRRIESALHSWLTSGSIDAFRAMSALGWKGSIPQEQRDFYMRLYEKLYPEEGRHEHYARLARYLAQSWARHSLGVRSTTRWDPSTYLLLSFPPPVPGMPRELERRRLYLRTMNAKHTRTHMPPWRGRGVLCVTDAHGGTIVTPKMVHFNDRLTLIENVVEVSDEDRAQNIRADYYVKEEEE